MASSREATLEQELADAKRELVEERVLSQHYRRQFEATLIGNARVASRPPPAQPALLARFKEVYKKAAPDKPAPSGELTGALLHFLKVLSRPQVPDGETDAGGPLESVEAVSDGML